MGQRHAAPTLTQGNAELGYDAEQQCLTIFDDDERPEAPLRPVWEDLLCWHKGIMLISQFFFCFSSVLVLRPWPTGAQRLNIRVPDEDPAQIMGEEGR